MDIENDKLLKGLGEIEKKQQQIKEDIDFVNDLQESYLIKRNRNYRRIVVIGSAAAIIFLFLSIAGPSLSKINYSDLFLESYSPVDSDIIMRNNDGDFSPLVKAIGFYHNQEYLKADILLDSLLLKKIMDEQVLFYKALVELESKKIYESKQRLSNLLSAGGTISFQARWYLILIEIIEKNPEKAKKHLKYLKKAPGKPYEKEVRKLLQKLRFRKTK
ncbi:MAG: hypothetical protein H8E34_12785 [Bacteroidetes bacterium]|nr:hypothetical protein [Bacteroidota bacterium]